MQYSLPLAFIMQLLMYPFTDANLTILKITYPYLYIPITFTSIILYYAIAVLLKNNSILKFLVINSLVILPLKSLYIEPQYSYSVESVIYP